MGAYATPLRLIAMSMHILLMHVFIVQEGYRTTCLQPSGRSWSFFGSTIRHSPSHVRASTLFRFLLPLPTCLHILLTFPCAHFSYPCFLDTKAFPSHGLSFHISLLFLVRLQESKSYGLRCQYPVKRGVDASYMHSWTVMHYFHDRKHYTFT